MKSLHTIKYLSLVTLFIFMLAACDKDDTPPTNQAEFETYLQDEMSSQNIPAMSVSLFKADEILMEKQFGSADLEQNIALDGEDLFLLASISKVVTATALLQLYDDGLFSLDDPINDYLSFNVSVPNFTEAITFRMLLTHTSGIMDGSALDSQYYYGEDSPIALDYFMENYLTPGGEFYNAEENFNDYQPGTENDYSNEGSALIAVLVEQIAGLDFKTYCAENIFTPLGMSRSYWSLEAAQNAHQLVVPYNFNNGNYEAVQNYTFTDYPNGGLYSTASDLHKLLSTLSQNGTANNYELLKSSTVAEMITPQIPSLDDNMGLHFFLMNTANNLWGHDGGEEGAATIMAFNPDTQVGAIILCNQGDANLDKILEESYKFGLTL